MLHFRQESLADHVTQRFKCEIGIHCFNSITGEHGKMVHFARLARLKHQPDLGTRACADHVMMRPCSGQQCGDGSKFLVDAPVGKDDHGVSLADGHIYLRTDYFQRLVQATASL